MPETPRQILERTSGRPAQSKTLSYEEVLTRVKLNPCWAAIRICTLTHLLEEVNDGLGRLIDKADELHSFQGKPHAKPGDKL